MKIKKLLVLCMMGLLWLTNRHKVAEAEVLTEDAAVGSVAEAEEPVVEVLWGEEAEVELVLPGTGDIYTLYGTLMGNADFASFLPLKEKPGQWYQALLSEEAGGQGKLLLSRLCRSDGENLRVKLRVKGNRIGTTVLTLADGYYVSEDRQWAEAKFPEITVKVLPNPLIIQVLGTMGPTGWYKDEPTVRITDQDAAWIYYSLDGDEEQPYKGEFQVEDGAWTLTVRTDDGYGYQKTETEEIHVDGETPVLCAFPEEADWQGSTIEVAFQAWDAVSGIAKARWAVSESEKTAEDWQNFSGEMTCPVEEDGIYFLHLWTSDVAGNEMAAVFGPYRKDSVAPEIWITNLEQNVLVVNGITPEIVTEDYSGIASVEYYLDGKAWEPGEIRGKGVHTLSVAAVDRAGNRAERSVDFAIYDELSVTCEAGDTRYSEYSLLRTEVAYREMPLAGREVTFFVNGEEAGSAVTDENGVAVLLSPVWIAPQEAAVTAWVAQEDDNFYAGTKAETILTVKQEHAAAVYTGDWVVKQGDVIRMRMETAEIPDGLKGDMANAVFHAVLSYIGEDGSRSTAGEWNLIPDENGEAEWYGTYETGLYELTVSCAENSYYTVHPLKLYLTVYDIQADYEDGTAGLFIDLPNIGLRIAAELRLVPVPDISVEASLRIPGTGIVLTENDITGCDLTSEGLVLIGMAQHPETGKLHRYRMKMEFTAGVVVTGLEAAVWEGEAPAEGETEEPIYEFRWEMDEIKR